MVTETLRTVLQEFPNTTHVRNICNPGKSQCRFLAKVDGKNQCEMNTSAGSLLAYYEKNPINCGGILEKIDTIKDSLVGKSVIYEDPPFLKIVETIRNITVKGDVIYFALNDITPVYGDPIIDFSDQGISFQPRQGIDPKLIEKVTIILPKIDHSDLNQLNLPDNKHKTQQFDLNSVWKQVRSFLKNFHH